MMALRVVDVSIGPSVGTIGMLANAIFRAVGVNARVSRKVVSVCASAIGMFANSFRIHMGSIPDAIVSIGQDKRRPAKVLYGFGAKRIGSVDMRNTGPRGTAEPQSIKPAKVVVASRFRFRLICPLYAMVSILFSSLVRPLSAHTDGASAVPIRGKGRLLVGVKRVP